MDDATVCTDLSGDILTPRWDDEFNCKQECLVGIVIGDEKNGGFVPLPVQEDTMTIVGVLCAKCSTLLNMLGTETAKDISDVIIKKQRAEEWEKEVEEYEKELNEASEESARAYARLKQRLKETMESAEQAIEELENEPNESSWRIAREISLRKQELKFAEDLEKKIDKEELNRQSLKAAKTRNFAELKQELWVAIKFLKLWMWWLERQSRVVDLLRELVFSVEERRSYVYCNGLTEILGIVGKMIFPLSKLCGGFLSGLVRGATTGTATTMALAAAGNDNFAGNEMERDSDSQHKKDN